jgi:hypothetical protein
VRHPRRIAIGVLVLSLAAGVAAAADPGEPRRAPSQTRAPGAFGLLVGQRAATDDQARLAVASDLRIPVARWTSGVVTPVARYASAAGLLAVPAGEGLRASAPSPPAAGRFALRPPSADAAPAG